MIISVKAIRFDEQTLWAHLDDGRAIGVPLSGFPGLLNATPVQRQEYTISKLGGLHWEALDEDISVAGLLAGRGDLTHRWSSAA